MIFDFSEEKDELLKASRGISFRDVVSILEDDQFIIEAKHPNEEKYPNQRVYYVEFQGYIYVVPFTKNDDKIFLKTIYPSRKATKKLRGKK